MGFEAKSMHGLPCTDSPRVSSVDNIYRPNVQYVQAISVSARCYWHIFMTNDIFNDDLMR